MTEWLIAALFCSLLAAPPSPAQQRAASDFEIAQMEKQLSTAHDFTSQLSGHLNLGDARMARNEPSLARTEYELALNVATNERLNARRDSEMARYSTATAYAGVAAAKLGDDARAFQLLEEAIRYTSDSAKTWNLYSTAMGLLGRTAKATSASRNAVTIARAEGANGGNGLDLAIYEYALASALGDTPESEQLLREAITSLKSPAFDSLRREVARGEQFEIYSSARGEPAAYLSLLNRAQLRLAQLYEAHGDATRARQQYESVLASRSDDPIALVALVRLARNDTERERAFADAFDANPFSLPLARGYLKTQHAGTVEGDTTGAQVRRALLAMQHGESHSARTQLDALQKTFPANETLRTLRNEAEPDRGLPKNTTPSAAELRAVIALFDHITPQQRAALDAMTFTSTATFASAGANAPEGQTIFESGTIDGVPFKFSEPTAFRGIFRANEPVQLTYRILGATDVGGREGLLVEPVAISPDKP